MKRIIITHLFLLAGVLLYAQFNCSFTHYSAEDGLSQNTVMSMVQDHKGIMWFATWNGIDSFDGYTFKTYKSNYGNDVNLTHNRVDYINEDKYGYLWALTYDNRVHRFNPSTETFEHVPAEKQLSAIKILSIKLLPSGSVWLFTDNQGIMRVKTDSLTRHFFTTYYSCESNFIPARNVNDIFQDNDGNEWLLGNNGLGKIGNNSNEPISYFSDLKNKSQCRAFYSAYDDGDKIYFGASKGCLLCYEKKNQSFTTIQMPTQSYLVGVHAIGEKTLLAASSTDGFYIYHIDTKKITSYSASKYGTYFDAPVLSIFVDDSLEVWFEQRVIGRIIHFNPNTRNIKAEHLCIEPSLVKGNFPAFNIHQDCNGITWVQPYGGGFSYFDRTNNRLVPFYNNPLSSNWKFSNAIHSAYSDRQGNLWMCTRSKGLEKISFYHSPFSLLRLPKISDRDFLAREVRALFVDSTHKIWVSHMDGSLRIYDADLHELGVLTKEGKIVKGGTSLKGVVYSMMQDHNGNIWLGTKGDGLICAIPDGNGYKLTRYMYDPNDIYSLSNNNIYSIHEDARHRIWIATFGGGINYIEAYKNKKIKFISYRNKLVDYPIEQCYRSRVITSDSLHRIWVGTTVGLLVFDDKFTNPQNIKFEHYVHDQHDRSSLSCNDVFSILVTRDRNLYFATFGGGLNKLDSSSKPGFYKFITYLQDNNSSSDILLSLQEDWRGNVWFSTENGISKFTPSTKTFENYNRHNFNFSTRFNEAASAQKKDGTMLFGTSDGILYFKPDSIKLNSYVPSIVFTRLLIKNEDVPLGNHSVLNKAVDDMKELTLSHKENIFTLQYAALDMDAPSNIHYAYKLEGLDDNWSYVDGQRTATYTNLRKGKYVFKVKSTNSDGVWVDNVRSLPITILPSFWETPLAYLLYVLFVFFILFITIYILFTIFRLKHKVSVEHEIADIKLRFFTDISHELRTPLTLISGPIDYVLQRNDLPKEARDQLMVVQHNTNRMLNLVNQILDFRKIQSNRMKLHISYVEVVGFIRKIMENFDAMAVEHHIDFIFETESNAVYLWVDEDKFEKIIFNLISNAFKYTPEGKMIKVFLYEEEKKCIIGVQDQGVGIQESKKDSIFLRFENVLDKNLFNSNSTGLGLSLVKELTEMHKGTIRLESKIGVGSTFYVTLLKGHEHYDKDTEYIINDKILNIGFENVNAEEDECDELSEPIDKNKEIMLIVEDNQELRQFLKTIFENKFSIVEAVNGKDGLSKSILYVPDIIISDIMMPEKDGLEMTKELRSNITTSHIPIMLLTAKVTTDDQMAGFQNGADAYITKPFNSSYLQARVDNLLKRRNNLQKFYVSHILDHSEKIYKENENSNEHLQGYNEQMDETQNNLSQKDRKFLDRLSQLMKENLDNSELMVDDLARELAISRSVFFKKLKALTGLAPVEFIREVRIKHAAALIESDEYSIMEISEMVGIMDSRYFSKCFKKIYGITPTEYKEQKLHKNNRNMHK